MLIEFSVCPWESILQAALLIFVSHMLRCSICLVQSWCENWVGSSRWCVSQPFSSLTELAAWGLASQPPLLCNGERVFRLKAWLLSEFRGVALESRTLHLGSLPPLQPPADLGCAWLHRRDPFSCILLFRGADKWLPLSSHFLVVVIFPLHSLACANNNISHLSDTFSPLSFKHFTNKQLLLLPSEF